MREQLDRAGQRASLRQQLAVQLTVAGLDLLDLVVAQWPADLARHGPGEQPPAHANAPMDPPTFQRQPGFRQGPLPGEDMRIDGIDQRAIQVEDQCSCHVANLRDFR